MAFKVTRETDGIRLVLSGEVTVVEARELHAALCELVPAEDPVIVEESEVLAVDTSAVQLVLAFARARSAAGREVRVAEGDVLARLRQLALDGPLAR